MRKLCRNMCTKLQNTIYAHYTFRDNNANTNIHIETLHKIKTVRTQYKSFLKTIRTRFKNNLNIETTIEKQHKH